MQAKATAGSNSFSERLRQVASKGRLGSTVAAGDMSYSIVDHVGHTYIGLSSGSHPVILFPMDSERAATVRTLGFVAKTIPNVAYDIDGKRWSGGCFVVEATTAQLSQLFEFLCADLFARTASIESDRLAHVVQAVIGEWVRFFQRSRRLTPEEQCGLWGELWVIANGPDPDAWTSDWNGPSGDEHDFWIEGVGLEVKTSQRHMQHSFSLSQVQPAADGAKIFVASIYVKKDDRSGTSVADLAKSIVSRLSDPSALVKKLPVHVLANADDPELLKFTMADRPMLFRAQDVPQVRSVDPGVVSVRFDAMLDPEKALETTDIPKFLATLLK